MQDITIWTGWAKDIKKIKNDVLLVIITNPPNMTIPNIRNVWISSRMGAADDIIAQYRPGCIVHAQGSVHSRVNNGGQSFLFMRPSFVYIGHTKYMSDNPRQLKEQSLEDEEIRSALSTVCLHKPMQLESEAQMQLPTNHLQILDDQAE